ncbi:hypothetical protein PQ465_20065 [Sphingobacterium oryzagri]|uniref:Uncharacterized protein n=1 Tax=Sphingobacterium oryzagri TaxID=3025669 RepID=A0ABY7WJ39_9SPHI|nr:DUF6695 family protein [Sphingobacterium sp. KACC 22765]WDF68577.1 hypothetical protein PQ465_20065 [Sphingobacterium sp. KACC 22765]
MQPNQIDYDDLAIILTWPDATIRGDERWMMFFKKIGIVKNLNFKVGHTGIVIIKRNTGEMLFYDFGRYIAPRGYGRARSRFSDPRLAIDLKATFEGQDIANLSDIILQFEELKGAMYGEGILYFSIANGLNFELAKAYGDDCVHQGTFPYGAVAKNNNNCSRFITRMLMKSSRTYRWNHSINFPETIKASPISNVVNAVADRMIYSFSNEQGLQYFRMNRWQSFGFLLQKLGDNVSRAKAALLPNDMIIGCMDFASKPITVPKEAQYLGGVGDGAWFTVQPNADGMVMVKRFTSKGELEYVVLGEPMENIDLSEPFEITYDSHLLFTHVRQYGRKIRINHVERLAVADYAYKDLKELYA